MVRGWLRAVMDWGAPTVCPDCEGGSGTILRPDSGRIDVCVTCNSSGRPQSSYRPRYVIPLPSGRGLFKRRAAPAQRVRGK
jgi:hypothetical protein